MNKCFMLYFLLLSTSLINAQDVIYMTSGEQRSVIVKKVGINTIEYIRFDNQEGAIYEILKSDVSKIVYQNGVEDVFPVDKSGNIPQGQNKGEFIDNRDSITYKYVVFGDQTWMAENLKFKIGDSFFFNDGSTDFEECGRYYDFNEALLACPDGWHLPSDNDWMEIEMKEGMSSMQAKQSGWRGTHPGQAPAFFKHGITGLDITPCGYLIPNMIFGPSQSYTLYHDVKEVYYWTSTEYSKSRAYFRHFKNRASIERYTISKNYRMPVRCIRD